MLISLYSQKKLIFATFLVYLVCFLTGLLLTDNTIIQSTPEGIQSTDPYLLKDFGILTLLRRNLLVILILILGGFSFGLFTSITLVFNGILFGSLIGDSANAGFSVKEILVLTLPHGIFELPAIWLAGTAGFLIAESFYSYIRYEKEPLTKKEQKDIISLSIVSILLMITACFIEAHLTPIGGGIK